MAVVVEDFGTDPKGKAVKKFILRNHKNAVVELTNYGATVISIKVPTKNGKLVDVALGFDDLKGFIEMKGYLGCMVGRVCNRIGRGTFSLDGKTYQLAINNGPNHLHGGIHGFSHKVWDYTIPDSTKALVVFTCTSPDGEENYPGNVRCQVQYSFNDEGQLSMEITANTDAATPLNITNHLYFNLAGEGMANVYDHEMSIFSDRFCLSDDDGLVTGEIKEVQGTPFDFRQPANLGDRIKQLVRSGFDSNYCLTTVPGQLTHAASVFSPQTGIQLDAYGTAPGVQLYTAQYLDQVGKGGKHYGKHSAFCLELQGYPDAVNKPHFPSVIVRPDKEYCQTIVYKFSVRN